jgi:hypothetical protein
MPLDATPGRRRKTARRSRRVVFAALGILLGLTVGLMGIALLLADRLEPVSRATLDRARGAWQTHGPSDYKLHLRVGGRRAGIVTLEVHDLDSAEDPVPGFGAPPGAQVVLRGQFDPHTGLPQRYKRYIPGTELDVEWEVTLFEPTSGLDGNSR